MEQMEVRQKEIEMFNVSMEDAISKSQEKQREYVCLLCNVLFIYWFRSEVFMALSQNVQVPQCQNSILPIFIMETVSEHPKLCFKMYKLYEIPCFISLSLTITKLDLMTF